MIGVTAPSFVGACASSQLIMLSVMAGPPIDDIAAGVASREQSNVLLNTSILVTIAPSRPLSDDGPWPSDTWLEQRQITSSSDHGTLRLSAMEPSYRERPPNVVTESSWDGQQFVERHWANSSVTIASKPDLDLWTDCLPLFNESDGPTFAAGRSLSELLRSDRVLETAKRNDELRYLISFDSENREVAEIILLNTDPPRLKSLRVDIKDNRESQSGNAVKVSVLFLVEEWSTYNGISLPSRAIRDGFLYHSSRREAEGLPPLRSRTTFVRESAAYEDAQSVRLRLPLKIKSGDVVHDYRYAIQYVAGTNQLELDDAIYETDEALLDDVGARLPTILHPGLAPVAFVKTQAAGYEAMRHDHMVLALTRGAGAFVVVLLVIVLVYRLRRST